MGIGSLLSRLLVSSGGSALQRWSAAHFWQIEVVTATSGICHTTGWNGEFGTNVSTGNQYLAAKPLAVTPQVALAG
jgi:hypothetical protein